MSMSTNDENLGYRWWIKVKNAPVVSSQIPLEAALSYPVCAQGELRLFHYKVSDGQIIRPFTFIRAPLPDVEVSELVIDYHGKLFPGLPGEPGVYDVEFDSARRTAILNLIPSLAQKYSREPAGETGQTFLQLFNQSVPEALKPFYEALNPQFFQWLSN